MSDTFRAEGQSRLLLSHDTIKFSPDYEDMSWQWLYYYPESQGLKYYHYYYYYSRWLVHLPAAPAVLGTRHSHVPICRYRNGNTSAIIDSIVLHCYSFHKLKSSKWATEQKYVTVHGRSVCLSVSQCHSDPNLPMLATTCCRRHGTDAIGSW